MSKIITIKLTRGGSTSGPFTISDDWGNIIATEVTIGTLINGVSYNVDDNLTMITIESTGNCVFKKTKLISTVTPIQLRTTSFVKSVSACLWRHLTTVRTFNEFYGVVEPYIIEYVFSYQYQDEILQNVKSYDKVYKYLPDDTGVFSYTARLAVDNAWFNQAILYNNQQCTGVLTLVPKPQHNLRAYSLYPIYGTEDKIITYTKSDNFYQYNTFWDVVKDKNQTIAVTSCESLSYDGIINQANMDYSTRSFKKAPLRAKDLKVRHSLTDRSDIHIVSQFIVTPTQISYK
jgi:hypothetical protein